MYSQVEKPVERKCKTIATSVAKNKSKLKKVFGFMGNRSELIMQRKIHSLPEICSARQYLLISRKEETSKLTGKPEGICQLMALYHGTSTENAKKILENEPLKPRGNEDPLKIGDWARSGTGLYTSVSGKTASAFAAIFAKDSTVVNFTDVAFDSLMGIIHKENVEGAVHQVFNGSAKVGGTKADKLGVGNPERNLDKRKALVKHFLGDDKSRVDYVMAPTQGKGTVEVVFFTASGMDALNNSNKTVWNQD